MRLPNYSWVLGSVGQGISSNYCIHTGYAIVRPRNRKLLLSSDPILPQTIQTEFKLRDSLLVRATTAYKQGDKALAKELSRRGKVHGHNAQSMVLEAAQQVFWKYNDRRNLKYEIDLHGLYAFEALSALAAALPWAVTPYYVMTGRGNNSTVEPKLTRAVMDFCKSHGFKCKIHEINDGVVEIQHNGRKLLGELKRGYES